MAKKKSVIGPIIGIVLAVCVVGAIAGGGDNEPSEPTRSLPETVVSETTEETKESETIAIIETVATEAPTQPQEKEKTYILNTSSKKFHYPTCTSVGKISDSNKEEFTGLRSDLIDRGYDPCGNCNP